MPNHGAESLPFVPPPNLLMSPFLTSTPPAGKNGGGFLGHNGAARRGNRVCAEKDAKIERQEWRKRFEGHRRTKCHVLEVFLETPRGRQLEGGGVVTSVLGFFFDREGRGENEGSWKLGSKNVFLGHLNLLFVS